MPQFSTKRRVQHSASEMFDLVADVERYPQFVPLCRSLLVRETFTSRVTLDRTKLEILVEYLEGPFRKMNNRWSFRAAGERTSDVEFFLAYEFRSRTLALLMGS